MLVLDVRGARAGRALPRTSTDGRAFPIAGEQTGSVVVGGKVVPLSIFQRDRFQMVRASKLIIGIFGGLYGLTMLLSAVIYFLR
jgi:hypothetical protein